MQNNIKQYFVPRRFWKILKKILKQNISVTSILIKVAVTPFKEKKCCPFREKKVPFKRHYCPKITAQWPDAFDFCTVCQKSTENLHDLSLNIEDVNDMFNLKKKETVYIYSN